MKKVFVMMSLFFLFTANSVQAISIDNQSEMMIINGMNVYKSDIKKIQYSSPDESTQLHMRSGEILAFYSSYDDYRQIKSAYSTKSYVVARTYYIRPYYGAYYPNPNAVSHN
mgnify:CR=1 FL=1